MTLTEKHQETKEPHDHGLADLLKSRLHYEILTPSLMPQDEKKISIFVKGKPPSRRLALSYPQILSRQYQKPDENSLKSSAIRRAEDIIARVCPFISVITTEKQQELIRVFSEFINNDELIVEVPGVVVKENYTGNLVADSLGLMSPELRYPTISIHIYDRKTGIFVREIEIKFIDPNEERRIGKVQRYLDSLSADELNRHAAEIQLLHDSFQDDGLMKRLITNPKSIGLIANRMGYSTIDLHEIIMQYKTVTEFFKKILAQPSLMPALLQPLSEPQKTILIQKIVKFYVSNKLEKITSSPSAVVQVAISIATQEKADQAIIDSLQRMKDDLDQGLQRYQHNISRGGFLSKISRRGLIDIFRGKKLTHWELFKKILDSGKLLPARGGYTKGTYLQTAKLGHDSAFELYGFTLEEIIERDGVNTAASPFIEYAKYFGNERIVYEIATVPLPRFKHQNCSVRYVPTQLPRELRRIIVERDEDVKRVKQLLGTCTDTEGRVVYQDVQVCTIEQWKQEIRLIEKAEKKLSHDTFLSV